MPKTIFVSYRRKDSGPAAWRLAEALSNAFGMRSVFIDTDTIRVGDHWPDRINDSLKAASFLVAVIGPQWLQIHDPYGRRRIDLPDDWVRAEVLHALNNKIRLIPVLTGGASPLPPDGLPAELRGLAAIQAYPIDDNFVKRDTQFLIQQLTTLGLPVIETDIFYPAPLDESAPLSEEELNTIPSTLPGWQVVRSRPSNKQGMENKIELFRLYKFRSFEDAIHFMNTASRYITAIDHHPDWQNVWVNVRVWLSTFDIGHRPTYKDRRLAEYLDRLFLEYQSKR